MAMVRREKNGILMTNKGFSLVEVLVCVALIAIISIPIFAGIRTSAQLNFDAHNVQMVTTFAQTEMEMVKALSVDAYTNKMAVEGSAPIPITDESVYPQEYNRARTIMNNFSDLASLTQAQKKELFEPFYYEKTGVSISGSDYTMRVIFEPAPYSVENAGTAQKASDINVTAFTDITKADGAIYPVITDEINQFEGNNGVADTIVSNMKTKLEALGISKTEQEIATQLKKEVVVDISTQAAAGGKQVKVVCDVTYTCGGAEMYYRVYSGTYPYTPTVSEKSANPAILADAGELGGGNVFIFAKAYQPSNVTLTDAAHCINEIVINGGTDTDAPINVYLIRGYVTDPTGSNKIDYNFDKVIVNGADYMSSPVMLDKGQCSFGNGIFVSNIHSAVWNRSGAIDSAESDLEKIIGHGEYKTRCYDVAIELFDDEGTKVARVESAKTDK